MYTQKRIKVFLSGVVNTTNAQNLNCCALMQYLNPERFEVKALSLYSGNLSLPDKESFGHSNIRTFHINYPAKIWHPIQLIRGILWSDVAYLCKPEYWRIQSYLVKHIHKKAFQTIEGVFTGTNFEKAKTTYGDIADICEACSYTGHSYSITEAMKEPNAKAIGLKTEKEVLYLGAELALFENDVPRTKLTDIAIIGGNLFYKGLDDYLKIAKHYPQLTFHIIGSGMGKVEPKTEVERLGLKNVVCHGSLDHGHIAELLKSIQLHIFPSRAEGFPKVTLETAAAGVPSVVYGDYGADEWIENGKSGFVVNTLDEMISVVQDLIDHPEKLQKLADNARGMAKRFDWKVLVKNWEKVIEKIYEA